MLIKICSGILYMRPSNESMDIHCLSLMHISLIYMHFVQNTEIRSYKHDFNVPQKRSDDVLLKIQIKYSKIYGPYLSLH